MWPRFINHRKRCNICSIDKNEEGVGGNISWAVMLPVSNEEAISVFSTKESYGEKRDSDISTVQLALWFQGFTADQEGMGLNPWRDSTWCAYWKWKISGVQVVYSTLVTSPWYVLPDIEHCLSSCIKITAWHVIGRFTCPIHSRWHFSTPSPWLCSPKKVY